MCWTNTGLEVASSLHVDRGYIVEKPGQEAGIISIATIWPQEAIASERPTRLRSACTVNDQGASRQTVVCQSSPSAESLQRPGSGIHGAAAIDL